MRTHYSIWAEVHDSMVHDEFCEFCGSTRGVRTVDDVLSLCGKCARELENEQETENEDESN